MKTFFCEVVVLIFDMTLFVSCVYVYVCVLYSIDIDSLTKVIVSICTSTQTWMNCFCDCEHAFTVFFLTIYVYIFLFHLRSINWKAHRINKMNHTFLSFASLNGLPFSVVIQIWTLLTGFAILQLEAHFYIFITSKYCAIYAFAFFESKLRDYEITRLQYIYLNLTAYHISSISCVLIIMVRLYYQ